MKETEKLKPCPFCGGEAEINVVWGKYFSPYCKECGTYHDREYVSKKAATAAWNKRACKL